MKMLFKAVLQRLIIIKKRLDKLNLKWYQQGNPFSLEVMDACKYKDRISELETLKFIAESNLDLKCEVTNHEFLLLRGEI